MKGEVKYYKPHNFSRYGSSDADEKKTWKRLKVGCHILSSVTKGPLYALRCLSRSVVISIQYGIMGGEGRRELNKNDD